MAHWEIEMKLFHKLSIQNTFLLSTQELNFKPKAYPFYIITNHPAPPPYLLTNEAHTDISLTNQGTAPDDGLANDI